MAKKPLEDELARIDRDLGPHREHTSYWGTVKADALQQDLPRVEWHAEAAAAEWGGAAATYDAWDRRCEALDDASGYLQEIQQRVAAARQEAQQARAAALLALSGKDAVLEAAVHDVQGTTLFIAGLGPKPPSEEGVLLIERRLAHRYQGLALQEEIKAIPSAGAALPLVELPPCPQGVRPLLRHLLSLEEPQAERAAHALPAADASAGGLPPVARGNEGAGAGCTSADAAGAGGPGAPAEGAAALPLGGSDGGSSSAAALEEATLEEAELAAPPSPPAPAALVTIAAPPAPVLPGPPAFMAPALAGAAVQGSAVGAGSGGSGEATSARRPPSRVPSQLSFLLSRPPPGPGAVASRTAAAAAAVAPGANFTSAIPTAPLITPPTGDGNQAGGGGRSNSASPKRGVSSTAEAAVGKAGRTGPSVDVEQHVSENAGK